MDRALQPSAGASAEEVMRVQDLTDRIDVVRRRLKRNDVRLGLLGAFGAVSVYVGAFINPAGFFGLLMIPQFLVPLMSRRRRMSAEREELLELLAAGGSVDSTSVHGGRS